MSGQAGQKMIALVLTTLTIVNGLPQLKRENSYFRLTSHAPRSFVKHGDQIGYEFDLDLDIKGQLDEMKIVINGTDIKKMDVNAESSVVLYEGLSKTHSGLVKFTVSDDAPLGSLLRPSIFLTFLQSGNVQEQATILGEYVFMGLPEVLVSNGNPLRIDTKETSEIGGKIRLPSGPMSKALLKVFMPNNVTISKDARNLYIEEPFLSVTNFELLSNAGLLKESVDLVGKVSPYYISNSRSSEIDEVSVGIPEVDVETGAAGELGFVVKTELLDFVGAADDFEMSIGLVLEVGDGIFIIRNSSVFTDMKNEVERVPLLSVLAELHETKLDEDQCSLKLEICLGHDAESWGSAYNISWNLYLPAFLRNVQVGRTNDILRRSRLLYNNRVVLESSVLEFELTRLSHVHTAQVVLNTTLDVDHEEFDKEQVTIYVEAVYNSWRMGDEHVTSDGFTFKLEIEKAPEIQRACKCIGNGLFECTCGDASQNGCDVTNHVTRCVDCDAPWDCVITIPGYEDGSHVTDGLGNQYRCGKPERNRHLIDMTPCIRIDKNGSVTELSAELGALLGTNINGDDVFGISRNGLAYMVSYDAGVTWYSIQENEFDNISRSPTFAHAHRVTD